MNDDERDPFEWEDDKPEDTRVYLQDPDCGPVGYQDAGGWHWGTELPLPQRLEISARILADRAREVQSLKDQADAVAKRMADRIANAQASYDWAFACLTPTLVEASEQMGQGASKFVDTPYGRVKWQKSRGSLKVVDPDLAIVWAEGHCPGAIQTKRTILTSSINDEQRAELELAEQNTGFEVTPPHSTLRFAPDLKS